MQHDTASGLFAKPSILFEFMITVLDQSKRKDPMNMTFHFFMIDDQLRNINQMRAFLATNGVDMDRFGYLEPNRLNHVIQCPEKILNHLPRWDAEEVRPIFIIDLILSNDVSEGYSIVAALWKKYQNNASYIINSVLCDADSAAHIPSGCRFHCYNQATHTPDGILSAFAAGHYPTHPGYEGKAPITMGGNILLINQLLGVLVSPTLKGNGMKEAVLKCLAMENQSNPSDTVLQTRLENSDWESAPEPQIQILREYLSTIC
ncbi:MAG: hypothetical protein AB1547_05855 [Thermodesulfobacteriota bacterium]